MKLPKVTIIDYGSGNLLSVKRGLEHCGVQVNLSANPDVILTAARVVLPGVGAFGNAIKELSRLQLIDVIRAIAHKGTPLLGICLGMQLLLDESEEFGLNPGLGLIPGRVVPIPTVSVDGKPQKIPHIGWNELLLPEGCSGWQGSILQAIEPRESVYFIHSFMANPASPNNQLANCVYGGVSIPAVIGKDNVWGCQFHPEKSGETGLKILRQFCEY